MLPIDPFSPTALKLLPWQEYAVMDGNADGLDICLLQGPRRCGKTTAVLHQGLLYALENPGSVGLVVVPDWQQFHLVLEPQINKLLNQLECVPKQHYRWNQRQHRLRFHNDSTILFITRLPYWTDAAWAYIADVHQCPQALFQSVVASLTQRITGSQRLFVESHRPLDPGTWQHALFVEQQHPYDELTVRTVTGNLAENKHIPAWMHPVMQAESPDWPEPSFIPEETETPHLYQHKTLKADATPLPKQPLSFASRALNVLNLMPPEEAPQAPATLQPPPTPASTDEMPTWLQVAFDALADTHGTREHPQKKNHWL
jgi:hypothetical protein